MEKLEQMCCYKIQAMKVAYPTKQLEHCRNSCDGYNQECINYIQINRTAIPFRKGRYAVLETR